MFQDVAIARGRVKSTIATNYFMEIQHCTKSKFCAIRDRSKIIEPLLESYLQVLVTTSLNGFTSYLLAIV